MKALRQKYDEEKAEEKVAAIQVSKRAQAKSVAGKVNIFQQEVWFLFVFNIFRADILWVLRQIFCMSQLMLTCSVWWSVGRFSQQLSQLSMAMVRLMPSFAVISIWAFKMC